MKTNKHATRSKRKNIMQPLDWWIAFENQAKSEKVSLSQWIGEAARKELPKEVSQSLTSRPKASRPKLESIDSEKKNKECY